MVKKVNRAETRKIRQKRVRAKVQGTSIKPRLCVYRSLNNIYANLINDETIQKYKFANFLSYIEHGIEQFGHFTNYLFDDILKATQEIQYVRVPKSFDVESDYVQKWHKASAIDHVIKTNFKITVEDMNS